MPATQLQVAMGIPLDRMPQIRSFYGLPEKVAAEMGVFGLGCFWGLGGGWVKIGVLVWCRLLGGMGYVCMVLVLVIFFLMVLVCILRGEDEVGRKAILSTNPAFAWGEFLRFLSTSMWKGL